MALQSVTISDADQYSTTITVTDKAFFVSIHDSDNFIGEITLQRKKSADSDWRDVKKYTGTFEDVGDSVGAWEYRIGCTKHKGGTIKAAIGDE